jgi:hypothetical protein
LVYGVGSPHTFGLASENGGAEGGGFYGRHAFDGLAEGVGLNLHEEVVGGCPAVGREDGWPWQA